ncbi:hypothetical protein ACFYV7_30805 [Nocardia suismassiliense]|uniref:YcxB-like protein domain-containing protein n=1 Tax=Nocardia suismassiliense TaxID=2077092 RepID=A0ABW6R135_9NOCA
MRDQDDEPSYGAAGLEAAAYSTSDGNSTAGQPNSARAQEFGTLPPIPAMERPDAVLKGTSEYAELLKAIVRRRARKQRRLIGLTYSVAIVLIIALMVLRQYEIAIAMIAFLTFLHQLRMGPLARSYQAIIPLEEQTLTIRFGPEAFELQGTDRRVRFPHNRFRAITVESDSITLRMRNTELDFPRKLFPDTAIDYLRARLAGREDVASPPPLPPLPPLNQLTATFSADPDTATRLALAFTWRKNRRLTRVNVATAAMVMLIVVAIAGKQGLVAGALAAGVMILVALAARLTAAMVDFVRMRKRFTAFAADGDLLATQFGPDAVAVRTPEYYGHERYDQITKLTIRRHVVFMNHGDRTATYPRELFPDRAIAHMRAAHPRARS